MATSSFEPVDSDVSPALLSLASQTAVAVSTTITAPNTPSGTVFPTAPSDGDSFIYTADSTNGIKWHFQYDSSQTTYKWVCIGGLPLLSTVTTQESTSSTTYAALATPGPSILLALAGDYDVTLGARVQDAQAAGTVCYMSFDIGGTGAVDADGLEHGIFGAATPSSIASLWNTRRKTAIAAATTLTAKYRSSTAVASAFDTRSMLAIPVRVAG